MNAKNCKTEFIGFLKKEFNLSQSVLAIKNSDNEKKIDYNRNSTKLQKVLDVFIEEESGKKNRIVDDVLIGVWKSASETEKRKIVESFIKKQKTRNNDFDEIAKLLKSGLKDWQPEALAGRHNKWKTAVMASVLFALVASAVIGRIFPMTADKISGVGEKLLMKPLYAFVYQGDIIPKNYLLDKIVVKKADLANFIRENSQYIKTPDSQNPYAIDVPVEQISAKTAAALQSAGHDVKVAGWEGDASVPDQPTLRERIISAAEAVAGKQMAITEKLNQELQDILNK